MTLEHPQSFELIETMVCTHRLVYLDQHLGRLQKSANFFNIPLRIHLLRESLIGLEKALRIPVRHKVRLTVRTSGEYSIALSPIKKAIPRYRAACLSPHRVDASDVYFYHKTTRRALYDTEYARISKNGFYEVLFLNKEGQLTEGSRTNLFVRLEGSYYTPPLSSGVLPGVYRQLLLNRCPQIQEKPLHLEDLRRADRIYLSNAVAGLQRIHHVDFT